MANAARVSNLRIVLGLGMVACALATGILQRSPWIMPFLATGFTCAYEFGQLRTWRHSRETGKLGLYWLQLPADFAVQFLLVSVLYFIGFGLSALFSGAVTVAAFAPGDAIWPLAAGAIGSILGLYIDRVEGKPASYYPLWASEMGITGDDYEEDEGRIRLLAEPVTVGSFFADVLVEARASVNAADTSAHTGLSDDDITRLEARLGRALPDLLIDLYQHQDGGPVNGLCLVPDDVSDAARIEDLICPFGAESELNPSGELETAWDALVAPHNFDWQLGTEVRGPDDRARIVLAQWNLELLFLDYSRPGPPRVGFADFSRFAEEGQPAPVTWWADFDAFFAALRHYEPA
ncbi:MAG: SMI1/KNR4 family protein [Hyphomonas sp.]